MLIRNDKDSKKSLLENTYLIFMQYFYDLGLPFLYESTLDISDLHSNHTVRESVMDLVLLAERSRKISILSTGHLQVKQQGHSLRRRANARNFNSSRWSIYIINLVDKTKLACYTPSPTQYNSFVKNLTAFTAFKLVENKFCFIFVYLSIYLSICWLVSFKIVFYSMIPSLDDVKFCRKRQQLEKKLVQLLKIMV